MLFSQQLVFEASTYQRWVLLLYIQVNLLDALSSLACLINDGFVLFHAHNRLLILVVFLLNSAQHLEFKCVLRVNFNFTCIIHGTNIFRVQCLTQLISIPSPSRKTTRNRILLETSYPSNPPLSTLVSVGRYKRYLW